MTQWPPPATKQPKTSTGTSVRQHLFDTLKSFSLHMKQVHLEIGYFQCPNLPLILFLLLGSIVTLGTWGEAERVKGLEGFEGGVQT